MTSLLVRAISGAAVVLAALGWSGGVKAQSAPPLTSVTQWLYQLHGDLQIVRRSSADLAVVDWDNVRWQSTVAALTQKPDGRRRIVISYLSIGEAEEERPYYKVCCATMRPNWLTTRTQGWPGNVAVRFWDAGWQTLVTARLEELIAQGFDGVYLDRIDIYDVMKDERPTGATDMVTFVQTLAAHARAKKPNFRVLVQNGEELLSNPAYLAAIDGIGKEDLLYGIDHKGTRNAPDVINYAVTDLKRASAVGKPVFVVEYVPMTADPNAAEREVAALGFVPLIAERSLSGK